MQCSSFANLEYDPKIKTYNRGINPNSDEQLRLCSNVLDIDKTPNSCDTQAQVGKLNTDDSFLEDIFGSQESKDLSECFQAPTSLKTPELGSYDDYISRDDVLIDYSHTRVTDHEYGVFQLSFMELIRCTVYIGPYTIRFVGNMDSTPEHILSGMSVSPYEPVNRLADSYGSHWRLVSWDGKPVEFHSPLETWELRGVPLGLGGKKIVGKPIQKPKSKGKQQSKPMAARSVPSRVKSTPSGTVKTTGLDMSPLAGRFYGAINQPFSQAAIGCKVPDPFSYPTTAYHLHQNTVFAPISGGTSFTAMLLPSPLASIIDVESVYSATSRVISTGMLQLSSTTGTGGYGTYGSTSASSLSSVFASYIVVSWGVKIMTNIPELSATGRVICAMVPCSQVMPSLTYISSSSQNDPNFFTHYCGLNATACASSSLLQLPASFEFSALQLSREDVIIAGTYTSPQFFHFRLASPANSFSSSAVEGTDVLETTATGLVTNATNSENVQMDGGVAIILHFEGLPTSNNSITLETIYHLEGTPASGATLSTPVPSMSSNPVVGSVTDVEKAIGRNSPSRAVSVIQGGLNFLDRNKDKIIGGLKLAGSMAALFV